MDTKSFFDSLKVLIMNELSHMRKIHSIIDLKTLCDDIENYVQALCIQLTYKFAYKLFKDIPNINFSDFFYDSNGNIYNVTAADDVLEKQKLLIAIISTTNTSNIELVRLYVCLNTTGKYTNFCVFIPKYLIKRSGIIEKFYKCILETIYHWFKEQILLFLNDTRTCVAKKLYAYMRSIVFKQSLLDNFWFAIVGQGYGFRLLDYDVTLKAFELIDNNIASSGSYTNKLLTELISTKLPTDQMLMQLAIDNEATLVGELSRAAYTNEGSIYSTTLYALYGGEKFVIVPLYIDEFSILALFPVDVKAEIEPILQENIVLIRQLILDELPNLVKAYDLFINYPHDTFSMTEIGVCARKILSFLNDARESISPFTSINIKSVFEGQYDYNEDIFDNAINILIDNQYIIKHSFNNYIITDSGIVCLRNGVRNIKESEMKNIEFNFYGGDFKNSLINSSIHGDINTCSSEIDIKQITEIISRIIQSSYQAKNDEREMIWREIDKLKVELSKTKPKKDEVYRILDWMSKITSIASFALKLKEIILPLIG